MEKNMKILTLVKLCVLLALALTSCVGMDAATYSQTPEIKIYNNHYHRMIIDDNGTLWGWGFNGIGQLGDGTTQERHSPVWIKDDVVSVSAGVRHTMAITSDGILWAGGAIIAAS